MSRSLYLIGPPGVGKTTVLSAVTAHLPRGDAVRLRGHLWGTPLGHLVVMLGRHRERFGGTDALSYGVMPDAVAWLRAGDLPPVIVGEGQRLTTGDFLRTLAAETEATVVVLHADPAVLDARCAERGSTQNASWRRGAATRVANATRAIMDSGAQVKIVDATAPLQSVIGEVLPCLLEMTVART